MKKYKYYMFYFCMPLLFSNSYSLTNEEVINEINNPSASIAKRISMQAPILGLIFGNIILKTKVPYAIGVIQIRAIKSFALQYRPIVGEFVESNVGHSIGFLTFNGEKYFEGTYQGAMVNYIPIVSFENQMEFFVVGGWQKIFFNHGILDIGGAIGRGMAKIQGSEDAIEYVDNTFTYRFHLNLGAVF